MQAVHRAETLPMRQAFFSQAPLAPDLAQFNLAALATHGAAAYAAGTRSVEAFGAGAASSGVFSDLSTKDSRGRFTAPLTLRHIGIILNEENQQRATTIPVHRTAVDPASFVRAARRDMVVYSPWVPAVRAALQV